VFAWKCLDDGNPGSTCPRSTGKGLANATLPRPDVEITGIIAPYPIRTDAIREVIMVFKRTAGG
jgi:hypothetical protein